MNSIQVASAGVRTVGCWSKDQLTLPVQAKNTRVAIYVPRETIGHWPKASHIPLRPELDQCLFHQLLRKDNFTAVKLSILFWVVRKGMWTLYVVISVSEEDTVSIFKT